MGCRLGTRYLPGKHLCLCNLKMDGMNLYLIALTYATLRASMAVPQQVDTPVSPYPCSSRTAGPEPPNAHMQLRSVRWFITGMCTFLQERRAIPLRWRGPGCGRSWGR